MNSLIDTKGRLAITCLFLFSLSLFLTAYSAKNPELGRIGFAIVAEGERPLQVFNEGLRDSVVGVWDNYVALVGIKEENRDLKERISTLEAHNSKLLEFESENKRLKSLLGVTEKTGLRGIVASVIGYDPSNWVQAVILNRGSADGVKPGMAVLQGNGLVGQVTSTSPGSSRVLLITDPLSGVDAIIQGNRARGVVEGDGSSLCTWRFVLREEEVKVGDRIITSGLDGVYPKALLVGVVLSAEVGSDGLFQAIRIKPSVDFSKLESVLVVQEEEAAG